MGSSKEIVMRMNVTSKETGMRMPVLISPVSSHFFPLLTFTCTLCNLQSNPVIMDTVGTKKSVRITGCPY